MTADNNQNATETSENEVETNGAENKTPNDTQTLAGRLSIEDFKERGLPVPDEVRKGKEDISIEEIAARLNDTAESDGDTQREIDELIAAFDSRSIEDDTDGEEIDFAQALAAESIGSVQDQQELLHQTFSRLTSDRGETEQTAFEACLRSLLVEMKWPGEDRHLIQAMPHAEEVDSLLEVRAILTRLGYRSTDRTLPTKRLMDKLPCIIVGNENDVYVGLRQVTDSRILVFDGQKREIRELNVPPGIVRVCLVEPIPEAERPEQGPQANWFQTTLSKFSSKIAVVALVTFLANLLALATPIYTMNVYNRVITSKSLDTLAFFFAGILVCLCMEVYLRSIRAKLIAYIGARFGAHLMSAGFDKILHLPINMIESSSVNAQVTRLRQFENVQSFFTGHLVSALLDLPFTIVFVVAIAFLHPVLALIPLALALVFCVCTVITMPITKRNITTTGKSRQRNTALMIETIQSVKTIREVRGEDMFLKRWQDSLFDYSRRRFSTQFFDTMLHTIAQSLVMVAGIATLWFGTQLVMTEDLSVGAMIAVMMFVWRVLSPIQTTFLSLNSISQFSETVRQANTLLSLRQERIFNEAPTISREYTGEITFENVSFRYTPRSEPLFRGLSLKIPAKQAIAITGETASGKSTILKMILGLYRPQAGGVYLDGLNLQQLDVDEVRSSFAYAAQKPEFFYGTLAQNIRLAHPNVTDAQIKRTLLEVGLWLPHSDLPDGLETRLTHQVLARLPSSLIQRLSLARAFAQNSPAYMFDAPAAALDPASVEAFFDKVNDLKGKATMIFATDDDRVMEKCDRVVHLRDGGIAFDGPAAQYLELKRKASKKAG